MKKLLAVLLALLSICSVFACAAAAETTTGPFDEVTKEDIVYCVVYKTETLSSIKCMYVPHPSVGNMGGPGYVTVTKDTPIAIDYDFECWKDSKGNLYRAGDKVYVNGIVELYPVMKEKTDNDSHVMRVIKCALASLSRVLQKAFGVFKDFEAVDTSIKESISASQTA